MEPEDIMRETIKFKLKSGLRPSEYEKLASSIRGAMFGYIRHQLVLNYKEALKCLNSHPDRDELYQIIKRKTNKLIDKKYEKISSRKKNAIKIIKELTPKI